MARTIHARTTSRFRVRMLRVVRAVENVFMAAVILLLWTVVAFALLLIGEAQHLD